jgi:uncharacterized protein
VVSGLISKHGLSHQLLLLWRRRQFTLVLTPDLRIEYERVLARPGFVLQYGLTPEQRAAFLRRLQANALHVRPKRTMPLSVRDPKDTMVLAAAFGGKAAYIVTGDVDLLDLAGDPRLGILQIVTVRAFLDLMASSD